MIKVCYSELDGPKGLSLRLEAAGHAGYAPAGQDISPDGRVYGKMGHAERRGDYVAKNITGEQDLKLFESGVKYFK